MAAWQPLNFQSHRVASIKEAVEINCTEHTQWREVRTASTEIALGPWKNNDRFLFYFSGIGTRGVSRWLKLVSEYDRGITPLVKLLDLEGATVDAALSQLGISLEAVGYQSLIESGKTPGQANRVIVEKRIDHLLGEVSGCLPFAHATFGKDFADSYNSVKHANRMPVSPDVKRAHFRQGVELLRVWVALRPSVKPSTLKSRR